MRARSIYGMLAFAVAVFAAAGDVSAQKYPERRVARQGTKLYDSGDFEGAETKYRHALEADPALREVQFNLAGALWRQAQGAAHEGQSEQEAQAIRAKAVEATKDWMAIAADSLAPVPMASAAGYNAGNVALAARQLDAAIEAYKMSLRLDPTDMEAKFNLAYAQKLKQEQEDNEDQQQDQNDQGGGDGGGQDEQDQQDGGEDEQDGEQDEQDGGGEDSGGEGGQNGNGEQPPGQGDGQDEQQQGGGEQEREATISPQDAAHMLEAMQGEEDKTREKMNAREVPAVGRSGKNW